MPPEMIKAREQFRIKNALLGLGLFGFAGFICASRSSRSLLLTLYSDSYSLMAVKQDDFSDIDKERPAAIEQSK